MKRRILIFVLATMFLAGGLFFYMRFAGREAEFSVTSTGPLDIRLWGIRPNGDDTIYDPNGKEIGETLGIARDKPFWGNSYQQFDLIFELPRTDEIPLFRKYLPFRASGKSKNMAGKRNTWILDYEDKKLLWLRMTFSRIYQHVFPGRVWVYKCDVDSIDLILEYYHGPPRESLCTFKGPFDLNSAVSSDDGVYSVSFTRDAGIKSGANTGFEMRTSNRPRAIGRVLVYDESGGRHLIDKGFTSAMQQGKPIQYNIRGVPIRNISKIVFGEQPCRTTFANINLNVGGAKRRAHGVYLDEMARKLNLKLTPEKLADYEFKSADEALEVIDIVRGKHILPAAEAILRGSRSAGRPTPVTLDDEQKQKLKDTLYRWMEALDPEFRAGAIRLGLFYEWPEFVKPALKLLENQAIRYDIKTCEANRKTSYALAGYGANLSDQAVGRVKEILLSCDNRYIIRGLKTSISRTKSQARIDAFWEFAMDDRPWLWWDAIEKLAFWGEFKGKEDSLPEKIELFLPAVMASYYSSNYDQISPRTYDMLAELLTPQFLAIDPDALHDVLRTILRHPDHAFATTASINFLRRIRDHDISTKYLTNAIVRHINLRHGSDIGGLGSDTSANIHLQHDCDWPAVAAEAIEWYDTEYKTADSNSVR